MTLEIIERIELVDVPSASGIARVNDQLFVVGDNSPYLFALSDRFQVQNRFLLPLEVNDTIIPKKQKPDFEAITAVESNGKKQLLIFGSGSKSPERDVLIVVDVDSQHNIRKFSLTDFYTAIIASTSLTSDTLNIEAAAAFEDRLLLFNREENMVMEFPLSGFLAHIENDDPVPGFTHCCLTLPKIAGVQAKISGATAIPNESTLVFTASVEDNPNPIDDGAILGSFVGLLDIDALENHYAPECNLLKEHHDILAIKVESVEVTNRNEDHSLHLLLVTDSDGAASELLHVVLRE